MSRFLYWIYQQLMPLLSQSWTPIYLLLSLYYALRIYKHICNYIGTGHLSIASISQTNLPIETIVLLSLSKDFGQNINILFQEFQEIGSQINISIIVTIIWNWNKNGIITYSINKIQDVELVIQNPWYIDLL